MDYKKRFLRAVTGVRALVILLCFLTMTQTDAGATTYYSVANGNWTSTVWSTVSSTTLPGIALPTLVDGDIIIIDNQVTISSGTVTIAAEVDIIIRTDFSENTTVTPAKLIFTGGGKLNLENANSSIVLENVTGGSSPNPMIDGTGNGNSNTIVVANVTFWTTSTGNGDLQGVGTLQPGGVLPIKLISFVATDLGNSIQLKWVTAMERNFSHFELEKSTGNLTFVPIAHIAGKGGLEVITSYIYLDSLPQNGKNYYRLKAVDYDLKFEYSPVVVVESKTEKQIVAYPNPAVGGSISVRTNFAPQEGDRIEIYNTLGLKLQEFDVIEHENVLPFNDTIKQGSYLLRYVSPTYSQVIRFYSN
jgi:hypothetical protein